jgi:CDP-diacylglycerol--serine O-phosphatidyltransferase
MFAGMNVKRNIPNLITCMNLLCGCLGIVFVFKESNHLAYSALFIVMAAVFDFLDGLIARLLNVHSEIGKQLDSLADMVSFGMLPGFMMVGLINASFQNQQQYSFHLAYLALLIPVFSALRLAKFNIDNRQTDSFIGVPTPANSILIASFPFLPICNPWLLIAVTIAMSFLLVSEIPLFALKFKDFSWRKNKIRYVFLGAVLLLLIILHFLAIPFIILLYLLLSFASNISNKTKNA